MLVGLTVGGFFNTPQEAQAIDIPHTTQTFSIFMVFISLAFICLPLLKKASDESRGELNKDASHNETTLDEVEKN